MDGWRVHYSYHDDLDRYYRPTPVENLPCLAYAKYGFQTSKQRCGTFAK